MSLLDSYWWRSPDQPVRAPVLPVSLGQCPVHEVEWEGPDGCWCCEAGIAPLKNY